MTHCVYAFKSLSHKCDPYSFLQLLVSHLIRVRSNITGRFMPISIPSELWTLNLWLCISRDVSVSGPSLFLNIGLNMSPLNSFMSNLYARLWYFVTSCNFKYLIFYFPCFHVSDSALCWPSTLVLSFPWTYSWIFLLKCVYQWDGDRSDVYIWLNKKKIRRERTLSW